MVVAVAVTGLLVMQSPPGPVQARTDAGSVAATANSGPQLRRSDLGTGSVQGRLLPSTIGGNSFEFTLKDGNGAPLAGKAVPVVTAGLPSEGLGLDSGIGGGEGGGRSHRADITLPTRGEWRFQVSVRVGTFDEPTAVMAFSVG